MYQKNDVAPLASTYAGSYEEMLRKREKDEGSVCAQV
jgi:hypothetical protein